ncbi:hypothetical protein QTI66_05370 [Variovorax sp. J22R133]|uniref:hypothetical protein n=1 Tax=Variovorax brevis TaxID=3053503 RepID=UPI0025754FED|nr:hypothetical protein [Variovorax sp. J22R133]MDM0111567.1 hypothetical protein [Variovorax sp. J22R133]
MRRGGLLFVVLAAVALVACSEKPQTNAGGVKQDAPPWTGTGGTATSGVNPAPGTPFSAPGWKGGDKLAWEQQLKARAQNGQNEYNKEN